MPVLCGLSHRGIEYGERRERRIDMQITCVGQMTSPLRHQGKSYTRQSFICISEILLNTNDIISVVVFIHSEKVTCHTKSAWRVKWINCVQ